MRTRHRIGRYRVIAPIGAGGFSTVYRALDEENDREVAIKVLAENHSMVPDTRRRFVDEFNLRATVSSPFIARMYEVGVVEETGQPYMVLELASRGDLRRRVEEIRRSHQVLNRADLMMLARHLTEALTALHEADIVHRDVSPGNILIRSHPASGARQGSLERGNVSLLEPGERFLLADLGHAKDLIRSSGFTAGGGTQGFAAPEQRDDITVVDHRADIFSATAIIEWAAHDGVHADDLEPFCDIGLAEDPDDRFPSMAAWYDGISAALGVEREGATNGRIRRRGRANDVAKAAAGAPASTNGQAARTRRRWPRVAALGALCLVPVAAGAVLGPSVVDQFTSDPARPAETVADETGTGSTTTVEGSTTTATDPEPLIVQPGAQARTSLEAPVDLAVIDGDLVIEGTAHDVGPGTEIEMTIHHLTSGRFWTPTGGSDAANPFPVALDAPNAEEPADRTFQLVIPDGDLEPGDYKIEVWPPRAPGDEGAETITRTVTVR